MENRGRTRINPMLCRLSPYLTLMRPPVVTKHNNPATEADERCCFSDHEPFRWLDARYAVAVRRPQVGSCS
jgi:hypothetical protein